MNVPMFHVDAFTERPFAGNPAAVCVLPSAREASWMQAVAAEMNLSETAFLLREGSGFRLRWFTPKLEVDLCGHATLVSAHVLWREIGLPADEPLNFLTRSGQLTAVRRETWIELNFPVEAPSVVAPPPGLLEALRATATYVGRNRFDFLLEVADESAVRSLDPDFAALGRLDMRGVIVTSRASSPDVDFVSRFFAPAAGVNEDPVTGSAHCCLGPYWQERLHKDTFVAHQVSARGGVVHVRMIPPRVILGGHAVTVMRGELCDKTMR
jgi:predicted PhzF superfamily epimerase YddE/YHI9